MPELPAREPNKKYLLGLDLGQAQDHSALSVIEREVKPNPDRHKPGERAFRVHYHVELLHRFPLGTPYTPQIAEYNVEDELRKHAVAALRLKLNQDGIEPASWERLEHSERERRVTVVIDASGNRAEGEHFRRKFVGLVSPRLVYITGGSEITPAQGGGYNVPKSYLKGVLQTVMGEQRITVADDLPDGELLKRELAAFRVKVTKAANEIYEANEGEHDDLVISIALPLWWGETYELKEPRQPSKPRRDPYRDAYYGMAGPSLNPH